MTNLWLTLAVLAIASLGAFAAVTMMRKRTEAERASVPSSLSQSVLADSLVPRSGTGLCGLSSRDAFEFEAAETLRTADLDGGANLFVAVAVRCGSSDLPSDTMRRAAALLLTGVAGESDTRGQLGDHHFGLLLTGSSSGHADQLLDQIDAAARELKGMSAELADLQLVTASLEVSNYEAVDVDTLFGRADAAVGVTSSADPLPVS